MDHYQRFLELAHYEIEARTAFAAQQRLALLAEKNRPQPVKMPQALRLALRQFRQMLDRVSGRGLRMADSSSEFNLVDTPAYIVTQTTN